jgi:hypothetical protein
LVLFNTGISPHDGLRAINELRELARDHPDRFWFTGMSFLLFTPWTTLAGLHLNVGLARLLRLSGGEAGNLLQARLRLHPWLPVTCLAERDGLVSTEEPDSALQMGRRKLFETERPWRHGDSRVRPVSRIALRYDLIGTELADELALQVERGLDRAAPRWRERPDEARQQHLLALVETASREPAALDETTLLERATTAMRAARRGALRSPGEPPFRVGTRRLALRELLERLAPVIHSGLGPVVSIAGVPRHQARAEMARMQPHATPRLRWTPSRAADALGRGTLHVSTADELLAEAANVRARLDDDDPRQRSEALRAWCALHAVPPCCGGAHAREARLAGLPLGWAAIAWRAENPGPLAPAIHPLYVPAIAFLPCRTDCAQASRR